MMFIFLVYGLLVFPYCYKCVFFFFHLRSFSQLIMADDDIENNLAIYLTIIGPKAR